jgi:hypothetical protein
LAANRGKGRLAASIGHACTLISLAWNSGGGRPSQNAEHDLCRGSGLSYSAAPANSFADSASRRCAARLRPRA